MNLPTANNQMMVIGAVLTLVASMALGQRRPVEGVTVYENPT